MAAEAELPALVTEETVSSDIDSDHRDDARRGDARRVMEIAPVEIADADDRGRADGRRDCCARKLQIVQCRPSRLRKRRVSTDATATVDSRRAGGVCEVWSPSPSTVAAQRLTRRLPTLPGRTSWFWPSTALQVRKGRGVIARTARWAAAIALIAMVAAVAATGTGFAGNGELLTIKDVCAIAAEGCSIVLGIP